MSGHALAAVALFAMGCASPARLVRPQPCPGKAPPPERISLELAIPHPEHVFIPPMPVPTTTHGNRLIVRAVIDTTGHVMRDSVMVCGIGDPLYAQRIAEEVVETRFRPGLMHARHVVAPTLLIYDF